jgi:hypothetical protein
MGISVNAANLIYGLKSNGYLKGGDAVMEIGAQQIENDLLESADTLKKLANAFNVPPFPPKPTWKVTQRNFLASGMEHLSANAPHARELYEHLGLRYDCVDLDDSFHSIKLDLNYDSVPPRLKSQYSLVTNFGTTEHAVNQLNAFKIMHDFVSRGGVMIHTVPFQGFPAHGLFCYAMQFFWMLCRSNLYKVLDVNLIAWNKFKMPDNILAFAQDNSRIFRNKQHVKTIEFQDVLIVIVLQKAYAIDFVPPIDVPNSATTDNEEMQKRYWTIFDPEQLSMYLKNKDS